MTVRFHRARSGERGVVLVTGLIILVVMTILGVTSMQTTVLEEKMAGNLRDRNVAFQAAEAGLQVALTYLEGRPTPPHVDATGSENVWPGCEISDNPDDCVRGDEDWLAANGIDYDDIVAGVSPLAGVASQPRIVVEERYVPVLDVEAAARGGGIHFYTVSALGYGVNAQTQALLTTTVAKVYEW